MNESDAKHLSRKTSGLSYGIAGLGIFLLASFPPLGNALALAAGVDVRRGYQAALLIAGLFMLSFGLRRRISLSNVLTQAVRNRPMLAVCALMSTVAIFGVTRTGFSEVGGSAISKWTLITVWLAALTLLFATRGTTGNALAAQSTTGAPQDSFLYNGIFAAGLLMCGVTWLSGPVNDEPHVTLGGSSTLVGCIGLIGVLVMSGRKNILLALLGAAPFVYLIVFSTTRTAVFGLCIAMPALMIRALRDSEGKLSLSRAPRMFARVAAFAVLFVMVGLPMFFPNRVYPYYAPVMNDGSINARFELLAARYGRYMRLLPLFWTTALDSWSPNANAFETPAQQTAFQFASNPNAEDRGSLWRRSLPATPSEWVRGRWPASFEVVSHLNHRYDYPHNGTIEVLYYFGIMPAVLFGAGTLSIGVVMWLRLAARSSAVERLSAAIVLTQLVQMNVMGTFEDHIAVIILLIVEVSLRVSNSDAAKRVDPGSESMLTIRPACTKLRPRNAAPDADRLVA